MKLETNTYLLIAILVSIKLVDRTFLQKTSVFTDKTISN